MANMKYFADTEKGTVEFNRVDYGRVAGEVWGFDKESRQWFKVNRKVNFKTNPSRHECDARCTQATGKNFNCQCKCGGKNHGRDS